jgi:hypothetical protein
MTTNSGQAQTQGTTDQMFDAVMKELIETGRSSLQAAARTEDAVKVALAQTVMTDLAGTISQASPFERALLVSALAPALAEAVAPALAEALAPALVDALSKMAASQKAGQESASGDGSERQEGR